MKKNKLVILCILVSIGTLFLVHIAYSMQAPFEFLESKWEAGDLISYIGTVALGIVAISQSARNFEFSEKLAEKQPFFIVTNYSASKVESIIDYFLGIENDDSTSNTHNGNKYVLYIDDADINNTEEKIIFDIELTNTSSAIEIVSFESAKSKKFKWSNSTIENSLKYLSILPGKKEKVGFIARKEFFEKCMNEKIYFEFILRNSFGKCYKETFELIINHLSKEGAIREGSFVIHCNIDNYKINGM